MGYPKGVSLVVSKGRQNIEGYNCRSLHLFVPSGTFSPIEKGSKRDLHKQGHVVPSHSRKEP
jgi:hypothetical protein